MTALVPTIGQKKFRRI